MSKYIMFTKDVGDYKSGEYSQVEDPVAKQFIDMKVAEAAPEDPIARTVAMSQRQVMASIEAQFQKQMEEQKAQAKKYEIASRDFARPKHNFAIGNPDWTSEKDKIRNQPENEWFRSLVYAICRDVDPEVRKQKHDFLTTDYNEGGWGCRAMAEGTGSLGGYTTPVLYESQVFEIASEQSIIVSRADIKPMGARQVEYPALNQYLTPSPGQSAFFGGMQIFRKGENTARAEVDVLWKKISLLAQDLTAYTEISRDLIQDSTVPMDAYVVRLMGQAIGWREDWESINGSGTGQFQGFLAGAVFAANAGTTQCPATIVVTRHLAANKFGNVNQAIDFNDILNMKIRMIVGARDPVWIVHPYSLATLGKLQDSSGRLIFVPYSYVGGLQTNQNPAPAGVGNQNWAGGFGGGNAGANQRLAGYLLGDPVLVSEKVTPPSTNATDATSTYGTTGELSYVDCKSYWVGRRSGIETGLSEHYLFKNDELAIRAKVRNDGRPGQLAPITLADGTSTVSGFVTLGSGVLA